MNKAIPFPVSSASRLKIPVTKFKWTETMATAYKSWQIKSVNKDNNNKKKDSDDA